MASPTTVIGVIGGFGVLALDFLLTGQINPDKLAEAMTLAGIGYFAADGKGFAPIIANVMNALLLRATKQDEVPHVIPSPMKLPEEPNRDQKRQRKKQSDKTKLKVVKNVK